MMLVRLEHDDLMRLVLSVFPMNDDAKSDRTIYEHGSPISSSSDRMKGATVPGWHTVNEQWMWNKLKLQKLKEPELYFIYRKCLKIKP